MEITGIQTVVVDGNFEWPLVRVETDAGISGYGEVRDHLRGYGHDETHYVRDPGALAEELESVLVGRDPTAVVERFEDLRPYGGPGRLGGGVSGVEIALWDITGKHLGVPVADLLGRRRDSVRVYCDAHAGHPIADSAVDYRPDGENYAPEAYAEHAEAVEAKGYDFLKFDLTPEACEPVTGRAGTRSGRLTEAGLQYLVDVVAAVREVLDPETDLGFDCAGLSGLTVTDAVRFGRAVDQFHLACLEDLRPHDDVEGWSRVTEAIETPTICGEDTYAREGFGDFVREEALNLVGPDLLTAGGIFETVRIAEAAGLHGMGTNLHFAGSPVGFAASVHAGAAIDDLLAVEFHAVGTPWWEDLVADGDSLIRDGQAAVPDAPGLGIELDHERVAEYAIDGDSFE